MRCNRANCAATGPIALEGSPGALQFAPVALGPIARNCSPLRRNRRNSSPLRRNRRNSSPLHRNRRNSSPLRRNRCPQQAQRKQTRKRRKFRRNGGLLQPKQRRHQSSVWRPTRADGEHIAGLLQQKGSALLKNAGRNGRQARRPGAHCRTIGTCYCSAIALQ